MHMVQYKVERLINVFRELDDLLHDYFRRTIASEGLPPLDMNWRMYLNLDDRDELMCLVAREHEKIIGFIMYIKMLHPHHKTVLVAACDIMAVHVDHRGKKVAQYMMQIAEMLLKDHGVNIITHQFRTCYNVEPIFTKLGYEHYETSYMKRIA